MTMKVKADRKLRTRVSHPSSIIVPTSDIKAPIQLAHLRMCRWFRLQKSFCCNLNTYKEERGKKWFVYHQNTRKNESLHDTQKKYLLGWVPDSSEADF